MMRWPSSRRTVVGVFFAAILVLSACSDLDDPERTTSSAPERSGPGPSSTTTLPPEAGDVPLFYAKGGRIHVSPDARSPGEPVTDGPHDSQPAPSPDGSQVAFVRSVSPTDPGGELWVVNADGTNARLLVHPELLPVPVDAVQAYVRSPRWSPDGENVAFVVPGELEGGLLVVAEASTGAQREMAPPPLVDDLFAWSPDGSRIAYMSAPPDVSPIEIGVMDAETGETTELVGNSNTTGVTWATPYDIFFSNAGVPAEIASVYDPAVNGLFEVDENGAMKTVAAQPETRYGDPAVLAGVETAESVAYTSSSPDPAVRTLSLWRIDLLLSPAPQLLAEGLVALRPATAWNAADEVAYVVDEARRILTVQAPDAADETQRAPRTVDEGVTSFAWPPPSIGAAATDIPPQ